MAFRGLPRRVRVLLAVLGLALAAPACDTWTELDEVSCPPAGTDLTYENFAQSFFDNHCNYCHSVDAADRFGAPRAYIFDTYDQTVLFGERIFLRAAANNDSMPPGPDDPPMDEREDLAEWIACGMPE